MKNKADMEQYRQVLIPSFRTDESGVSIDDHQKVREDFYDALTEFGMCLKLALSSRAFFEDGAFDEVTIQRYKRDLKFFTQLRAQAKQDAQETVDFSTYEEQIRRLVDKQVIGQEVKDPDGVILVGTLGEGEDPEDWSEEKTRSEADVIKTRLRKTIEQDLIDDPHAQRVFSEMLKEAIAEADALFDHPGKQYTMFKDLEDLVQARATPDVPDRFEDRPRAPAYYGAFLDQLGNQAAERPEDDLVEEAIWIDDTVNDAVRSHSINQASIEAAIKQAMLPRYFNFFGGLDEANAMIERIIGIVRAGATKGDR